MNTGIYIEDLGLLSKVQNSLKAAISLKPGLFLKTSKAAFIVHKKVKLKAESLADCDNFCASLFIIYLIYFLLS